MIRFPSNTTLAVALTCGLIGTLTPAPAHAHDGQEQQQLGGVIDMPHLLDPQLDVPTTAPVLHPRLESLWLAAMRRDEPGLNIQAMDAFVLARRNHNLQPQDATLAAMTDRLDPAQPLDVRLAAMRAVHACDHRAAADGVMTLLDLTPNPYVTPAVDAVLAAWDHAPARPVWRQRAADAGLPVAVRTSAARALGTVRDPESRDLLRDLAMDRAQPMDLRLAAATALGAFVDGGLTGDAATLRQQDELGALMAAKMLASHRSPDAVDLLAALTGHARPAVAAEAARLLADFAPASLDKKLAGHGDPQVRLAVARAASAEPSAEMVGVLGPLLDDPSVSVRKLARNTLIGWAERADLREAMVGPVERAWSGGGWRGREQAALIAGWIDHKPMAESLAASLDDPRPEVRLAVTGALRLLQVESTAGAMTGRVEAILAGAGESYAASVNGELTQLFLALGAMNRRETEPLYRRVVPKGSVPYMDGRAAAIYVLGKWHEGQRDAELERQLLSRFLDASVDNPEYGPVQIFSAIALGRMGAAERVSDLRSLATNELAPGGAPHQAAAMWAIEKITGETLEFPPVNSGYVRGWFLEPDE